MTQAVLICVCVCVCIGGVGGWRCGDRRKIHCVPFVWVVGHSAHYPEAAKSAPRPLPSLLLFLCPVQRKVPAGNQPLWSHCCLQSLPERGLPCHLYCTVTWLGSLEKWTASSAGHWSVCHTENMTTYWTLHCPPPPDSSINMFLAVRHLPVATSTWYQRCHCLLEDKYESII